MLFPEWKCSFNKRKALFTAFLKCQFKYCPIAWMFYSRHTSNKVNRLHETLRENCPNTEFFFWSVFSGIWTEYGEILRISPYSVRMRENMDQENFRIWTLFKQWESPLELFMMMTFQLLINYLLWTNLSVFTI